MNQSAKKLLFGLGCVIVVLIILGFVISYFSRQKGRVEVNLNLGASSQINGISLSFNNQAYKTTSLNSSYSLRSGSYELAIHKNGYKNFSTNFNLRTGGYIIINAILQLSSTPPLLNLSLLKYPGSSISNILNNVVYFYDNTWAVVSLQAGAGNNAVLVAQYNAASASWGVVIGPGTAFSASSIQNLPVQVKQYLNNNGYTFGGS